MHKKVLIIIVLLSVLSSQGVSAARQGAERNITILDRDDQATTTITDGDRIRVQITLAQISSAPETITFTLGNAALPVGSCVITNGNTSCQTEAFSSLGWYWDPNGAPQNTRVVQAKGNNGETIGQSSLIAVQPRPVVMVHGFISNWQAWTAYLSTNGNTSCETEAFSSLGWYWDPNGAPQNTRILQAKGNNGETIGQSNLIAVQPRPVVMVHGFISNWQAWTAYFSTNGFLASIGLQGFAVGDGQVPGAMNTGVITNPPGRTNTIAQNAEILGQYISNVKAQTGAEMVDLVVHSMGGMISRYYIDRVMQERDVAQLIMLGSPMGGSDCSVLPAALGFFLPASIEIRESYMRGVFNQQITHRKGIEFYDLGGTAINEAFKSPCTGIPNDTVVSFDSINAIVLQSSQLEVIHSDLTLSDKAFTDFVKPLLQKPSGSFSSQPDPAPVAPADPPLDFTRVYTGHVNSGGSTEITINVEPDIAVASFALYDASRSVTTVVRGANGNVIELDPQTNGFIQIDDPSSLFFLGYGFQNPRPGPWNITVQATENTPANGTDFAILVYFVGGAKLETSSATLVPQLRDDVELIANVSLNGQSLEITSAQAVIKNPNGEIETIDFPAGRNVAVVWTPRQAGTHAVDIVVTALAPDGSTIERTDFLAIEVQPNFSTGQITLNLILLVAGVLLVLGLIVFFIIRSFIRITRRTRG